MNQANSGIASQYHERRSQQKQASRWFSIVAVSLCLLLSFASPFASAEEQEVEYSTNDLETACAASDEGSCRTLTSEDWGGCSSLLSCGAFQLLTVNGNHSGINLKKRRDVPSEEALLEKAGGTAVPFAFIFDDPQSGLILDRTEISSDIKAIFHASDFHGRSATDFGVFMERAAEIHVIDSCFAFMPAVLKMEANARKVLHRYASVGRAYQGDKVRCPLIEHSFLPSSAAGWHILEQPHGALHLDVQIVYPADGDVVVVGSELGDLRADHAVIVSVRKVRALPPDVAITIHHNLPPGSSLNDYDARPLKVVLGAESNTQPRCPILSGVPMEDAGGACVATVRMDLPRTVTLGRSFSALTLSVGPRVSTPLLTWYTMASAEAEDAPDPQAGPVYGGPEPALTGNPPPCHEVDVFSAQEYLPSIACLEAGGRARSEERVRPCLDAMEASLLKRQLGAGGGCAEGETKVAGFANYGLGSTLHYLLVQLHRAAIRNERIAFIGEWVYAGCAARDFSCAFDPWSACAVRAGSPIDAAYPRFAPERQQPDAEFAACAGQHPNSRFHYASVLAAFLWRPNAAMRLAAIRARAAMRLPARYVGVHVRHGDFCVASKVVARESKECFSVLAYAEALQRMAGLYGARDVFVASDSEQSLEMLRGLCPGLRLHWQRDVDRAFLEAAVEDFAKEELWVESKLFKSSDARRRQHLVEIMVDVILLMEAVGIVGQFSSNISRLVVEVNSRRHKRIMPYISLDLAFCYNGGEGLVFVADDGSRIIPEGKDGDESYWYC